VKPGDDKKSARNSIAENATNRLRLTLIKNEYKAAGIFTSKGEITRTFFLFLSRQVPFSFPKPFEINSSRSFSHKPSLFPASAYALLNQASALPFIFFRGLIIYGNINDTPGGESNASDEYPGVYDLFRGLDAERGSGHFSHG
jgi:hypothetical protein